MARLKAFADLTARPIKRDDKFAVSVAASRTTSQDIERQKRQVGDMVPEPMWDGWEAALVALSQHRDFTRPKKGTGGAFADRRHARSGDCRARRASRCPERIS